MRSWGSSGSLRMHRSLTALRLEVMTMPGSVFVRCEVELRTQGNCTCIQCGDTHPLFEKTDDSDGELEGELVEVYDTGTGEVTVSSRAVIDTWERVAGHHGRRTIESLGWARSRGLHHPDEI